MKTILDNMEANGQNVLASVTLKKYYQACECANALAQTGPLRMEKEDLDIALAYLAEENRPLPWPVKLQVTQRAASDAALAIRDGKEEDIESLATAFWSILDIWPVFSLTGGMIDDWECQKPCFSSLAATLMDERPPDDDATEEQQEEWEVMATRPLT